MAAVRKVWAQLIPIAGGALASQARAFERAGVEGVWAPQMFGAPFATLAAVAPATSTLKLGTGIALAFVRSPLETACNAIDLDLISGGRVVLGLGSSAQSQIEGSFGSPYGKPLAHMAEIVSMIRAIAAKRSRIAGQRSPITASRRSICATSRASALAGKPPRYRPPSRGAISPP
ncbi:LLM class flavin-dependent oxidoreductase [Novosphingobium sp. BL-52-GroH]|uniref:LLM class flavin-dependent oxidoreductase n=1 Tax=Novosphingobium sp. BL-52-GroH TaxID=3349877 RepID=UPI00384B0BB4